MKDLIIFGLGPISELAHFYFNHDSPHKIAAFTVDAQYIKESTNSGLPVVPWEDITTHFPPSRFNAFIAISYAQLNHLRTRKVAEAEAKGYSLAHYISSKATIFPGFTPRPNQFILENNTIQPFASIGKNVTLWSGNQIGHHSTIEDNCFITSHVVISGNVTIGAGTFIGINATIRDSVKVGKGCLIGAGSLIMKNTGDDALYSVRGTPPSPIRASEFGRL